MYKVYNIAIFVYYEEVEIYDKNFPLHGKFSFFAAAINSQSSLFCVVQNKFPLRIAAAAVVISFDGIFSDPQHFYPCLTVSSPNDPNASITHPHLMAM